ncbi:hypothetical protein IWZ01DRAFT_558398 [Phyllosticta capitalensis]
MDESKRHKRDRSDISTASMSAPMPKRSTGKGPTQSQPENSFDRNPAMAFNAQDHIEAADRFASFSSEDVLFNSNNFELETALTNIQIVNSRMPSNTQRTTSSDEAASEQKQTVQYLLCHGPQAGINWQGNVEPIGVREEYSRWSIMVVDGEKTRFYARLLRSEYTKAEATTIANVVASVLNCCPLFTEWITSEKSPRTKSTSHLLTLSMFERFALPKRPIRIISPCYVDSEEKILLQVDLVDPVTNEVWEYNEGWPANCMPVNVQVADIGDGFQIRSGQTGDSYVGKTHGSFPSVVPGRLDQSTRNKLQNLERVARHLSSHLTGRMLTSDAALAISNSVFRSLTGRFRHREDTNKKGFGVKRSRENQFTLLRPDEEVDKDTSELLSALKLRSLSRGWASSVMETMENAWIQTGDVFQTWTVGAKAADEAEFLIACGEPPPIP